MTDDLIQRMETATEGSRELDAAIYRLLYSGKLVDLLRRSGVTDMEYCPDYTTSLDAALTLVPEGYRLYNLSDQLDDRRGRWFAGIANDVPPIVNPPATSYMAHAPSPPLALCIAALKARRTP